MTYFFIRENKVQSKISALTDVKFQNQFSDELQITESDVCVFDLQYTQDIANRLTQFACIKVLVIFPAEVNSISEDLLESFDDVIVLSSNSKFWEKKIISLGNNSFHYFNDSFENILDQIPLGIFVKDTTNNFQYKYWNKFLEKTLNLPREKVIGKTDFELFESESSEYHLEIEKNAISNCSPIEIYTEEISENRKILAHTIKNPVFDTAGNALGIVGVLEDVTELQKTQQKVKNYIDELENKTSELAKVNEELNNIFMSKEQLFGIIAHDLKSPFITLLGFLEVLQGDFDKISTEEKNYYLTEMNKVARTSYKLLDDLLQWARSQNKTIEPKMEKVNLSEIVNNVMSHVKIQADNKSIQIMSNINSAISIETDSEILQFIIRNILSNGIKFTPHGGTVSINYSLTDNFLEMVIKDSGIGITEDRLKSLIEFGYIDITEGTNKEKGTGLGLMISKQFTEKLGGKFNVSSTHNNGSEFKITLPLN